MKEEIRKALEEATQGDWKGNHAITPYISVSNGTVDEIIASVHSRNNLSLLANAPTWLKWQNERIEQLEKAFRNITEYAYQLLKDGEELEEGKNES